MKVTGSPISGVWAALCAALVAAVSFSPAMAQSGPRHGLNAHTPPSHPDSTAPRTATRFNSGPSGPASSLNSASWIALGPAALTSGPPNGVVSGRVTGIAVDPTDSNTIYLAAADGGVWKTTDGGTSWTPLTDTQTTLAMGAIAIAPTNHLRIYAGTGEANNAGDNVYGNGILVSSDGGSTWTLENPGGVFTRNSVGQIAVDPTDADIAYAAVGGYPTNGNIGVNYGIFKTTDGGTTWTNLTAGLFSGDATSLAWSAVVVDPNTHTTVYAAAGDMWDSFQHNGVFISTNSGSTWTRLANAPDGTTNGLVGRIALAVDPTATAAGKHRLYIAVAQIPGNGGNGGMEYFGRSDNADAATPTFTNLTTVVPDFLGDENGGGQGWYDIVVNVDSRGDVYCSGVENYNNGMQAIVTSPYPNVGASWTDISTVGTVTPHTDNHAIAFDSSNNMYAGNDGGIYMYNPASGGSWTDVNSNLNTIQFYGIGLHPTNLDIVAGGSQDNGTEVYSDALVWNETDGGDGGGTQISQSTPTRCYAMHPVDSFGINAFFQRSDDTCNTFTSAASGIAANTFNFVPPFFLDPGNEDHVLLGTDYINQTTDGGTSWTHIGTPGTNNFNTGDEPIDTVAMAPGATNVVYASAGGQFAANSYQYVTQNANAATPIWTPTAEPCTCRIAQMVVDPNDATGATVVAVNSNFSSSGSSHVFRSTNFGGSWTDITHNLPNLPTWSVRIATDPSKTMYVATDSKVYMSVSPYTNWSVYGTGLPNAQGLDLELNNSLNVLGVATHGRGAWEIYAPTHVVRVSSTEANGSYSAGTTIPITVTFTGEVTVSGVPQLALNTSPAATANYASGSGTNVLTFNYTVGSGQTTSGNATGGKLDYASAGALTLNGGTIEDGSLLPAVQTLYAPGAAGSLSANKSISTAFTPPALTSPAAGTFLGGATTFKWNAGSGSTEFQIYIGTTGAGSHNIYQGPDLSGSTTSSASINIPTNGATLYVRLWYLSGTWQHVDYTYSEASPPSISSPALGTLLGGSTTFTWNKGNGSTEFQLYLGTTAAGSSNLYQGPDLSGSATSSAAINIPANGATVYVRLWWVLNGVWYHVDTTYTEATHPSITSPASGTRLGGPTKFTWNPGSGANAFQLYVGTTGVGSRNIYQGPDLSGSTTTSASINIPLNGAALYVRLWYEKGTTWLYQDYTYAEATPPAMSTPAPGSTIGGSTKFTWNPGTGATGFQIYVGTTGTGSGNLYRGPDLPGSATSSASITIPANGAALNVRLWYVVNGSWLYQDYTYTEQ